MRVKKGFTKHRRHKKVLKLAKGMQQNRRRSYRLAKQAVNRSLQYSYRDRRNRKRDFRQLWITRISNACQLNGEKYSAFINKLKLKGIELDRKVLADIAVKDEASFKKLVEAVNKK
jgi:large subunit ribosomal protein L20